MIVADCKNHDIATETYIQSDNATYYIAEQGIGKTVETIRQSISRDALIVAPWEQPFQKYGFAKFVDKGKQPYAVTYLSLSQIRQLENDKPNLRLLSASYDEKKPLRVCVDEGRVMLEELLREKLGCPVKIDFMSLDAGEEVEEYD